MNNNPHLYRTVEGKEMLVALDPIQIDLTVPKNLPVVDASTVAQGNSVIWLASSNSSINLNGSFISSGQLQSLPASPPLLVRLYRAWRNYREKIYVKRHTVPVQEIFAAILGQGVKLKVLEGRLEAHNSAIEEAKKMGQTALVEQLTKNTEVIKAESVLYAAGQTQFIEERDLIRFAKECEFGLRLDYLKNFVRLISANIRQKKTRMDLLRVFDSYVILHYDPDNKGAALTEKEIAKKRDPILFGLINGSRRLYHVGSWVDEYCDLTFNDLIEKFGKDVLTLK